MENLLKILAFILVALFLVAYVFNHIDPWAGIAVGFAAVASFIYYLKRLNR